MGHDKIWKILLTGAIFLFLGYHFGRQSVRVETVETLRVDTVFYERPQPVKIFPPDFVAVRVPKLLIAPADTVRQTVYVTVAGSTGDSLDLRVPIVKKEYGDNTYRAQISGPEVGEYGPALDWIETYEKTWVRRRTVARRSRFAVTAGAGVAYTPQGFQPYAGVGVGVILWQW